MTIGKHTAAPHAAPHAAHATGSKTVASPRAPMSRLKKKAAKKAAATVAAAAAAEAEQTPTPTPMEEERTPSEAQSTSATAAAAAAASVDTSVPVYSTSEQKLIDLIANVTARLDDLRQRELSTLVRQFANHRTRLCLYRLHPRSWSFDAERLSRAQKQLIYSIGMVDEHALQQLFRLDSVQTDRPEIRRMRKETVAKANAVSKESLALKKRAQRLQRFVPAWTPSEEKPMPVDNEPMAEAEELKSNAPDQEAMQDEEEVESEEEAEEKAPATKQKAAPAAAPTPTPAALLQRKYAHLQLPTYAGPPFQARANPRTGALVIEGDLTGILSDDISVLPDLQARTLTVSGVRLPDRRRTAAHSFGGYFGAPARSAPFGFFTKTIDLSQLDPHGVLDPSALQATMDEHQRLEIVLPRKQVSKAAPMQQQTKQQQSRRQPVRHSTGVSYSSDEEADSHSHPYHQQQYQQRPQQQAPRRASAAQHPFFGGW